MNESQMISFDSNDSRKSTELVPRIRPEIAQQVEKCLTNGLKYNQPLTCLENSMKILNQAPCVKFQLPETKYKIKQSIDPAFEYEMHYHCKKCQLYTGFPRKQAIKIALVCTHCDDIIEKKSNKFFIYIPLRQQLKSSIKKHWDSILRFQNSDERDENSINLSLLLNTDGAQKFKSSKNGLWLIQLISNYLPPRLRYICSNIIVIGLHFGDRKPDTAQFFFPLVNEIRQIINNGYCLHPGESCEN